DFDPYIRPSARGGTPRLFQASLVPRFAHPRLLTRPPSGVKGPGLGEDAISLRCLGCWKALESTLDESTLDTSEFICRAVPKLSLQKRFAPARKAGWGTGSRKRSSFPPPCEGILMNGMRNRSQSGIASRAPALSHAPARNPRVVTWRFRWLG